MVDISRPISIQNLKSAFDSLSFSEKVAKEFNKSVDEICIRFCNENNIDIKDFAENSLHCFENDKLGFNGYLLYKDKKIIEFYTEFNDLSYKQIIKEVWKDA